MFIVGFESKLLPAITWKRRNQGRRWYATVSRPVLRDAGLGAQQGVSIGDKEQGVLQEAADLDEPISLELLGQGHRGKP